VIALVLVPALTAACGGGSGASSAAEQPRLTQKEFVAAANQVCIRSDRRIFRVGALTSDPSGWKKTALAARKGIEEMRALRPPAAKQKQFNAMIASGRRLAEDVADVHRSLVENDFVKARAAQARAAVADSRIKRQAFALGLTFCEQLLTNWPA
jgi:hypothetical protein